MPSNKDRLYVVLHARGGKVKMSGKEDTYHWSILIGPKKEKEGGTGTRFDVHERSTPTESRWIFEEQSVALIPVNMTLVRLLVAKIENKDETINVLRQTPVLQGNAEFNCVNWTKEALSRLSVTTNALGNGVTDWVTVRNTAMEYCQTKKDEHRFDGKVAFDLTKVPTYDLLAKKETSK